jgi:DNA-binding transcriptional regulator GbsR (MarR family)
MRSVDELVKECTEELQRESENNAKYAIKNCIQAIGQQQEIIKKAQEEIKKLQTLLKSVEVKPLPTDYLA